MKRSRRLTLDLPKVLCLGMSYSDIDAQIEEEGFRLDVLQRKDLCVAQVVECVRRSILTEMDGRDLARCVAMEKKHKVQAYTVSQEQAAMYDQSKHLHANFNRASFCKTLKKQFGEGVRFRQIILDYFWIPQGTWVMTHWTRSFFQQSLPYMADLLEQPKHDSNCSLTCGVIYLPFCFHCCKQLVASLGTLDQYFEISFLLRDELERHALWSGTSDIEPLTMQQYLGKRIRQEDIYCTFSPRDVSEAMDDCTVTKRDVIKYLRQIEDFKEVRMIQLKPLPAKLRGTGQHLGGFVGLQDPSRIERGYDQMLPSWNRVTDSSSEESEEEEEEPPTPPPKPKVVPVKKKRKQSVVKEPVAKKPKQTPPKKVYSMVEDMESYELLGSDKEVADYYELQGTMFPDFRRSYLEICNNEYNPKPLNRSMLNLINFKVDFRDIKPSEEKNAATITMLNDETEEDLRRVWNNALSIEPQKSLATNALMTEEVITNKFRTVLQELEIPVRSDLIELTLDQFWLRRLTAVDKERFPQMLMEFNAGDSGLFCKHCVHNGMFEGPVCSVPSKQSVYSTSCLETICNHLLNCNCCPAQIREKIKSQAIETSQQEREALQSINFDVSMGELNSSPTRDAAEDRTNNSAQSIEPFAGRDELVMDDGTGLAATEVLPRGEQYSYLTSSVKPWLPTVTPAKVDECDLSPTFSLASYIDSLTVQSRLKTEPDIDDTSSTQGIAKLGIPSPCNWADENNHSPRHTTISRPADTDDAAANVILSMSKAKSGRDDSDSQQEIAKFEIPAACNWPIEHNHSQMYIAESSPLETDPVLEDAAVNVILFKKNKQLYSTFHPYIVDFEQEEERAGKIDDLDSGPTEEIQRSFEDHVPPSSHILAADLPISLGNSW